MTRRGDRESELGNALPRAREHDESRKNRHRRRPCGGNTPSAPTGLAFSWETVEKGRHRRLAVMLDWNPVRTNTSGAESRMERYRVQLERSNDAGATRAGKPRKWLVSEATVRKITSAAIHSGTIAEFHTDDVHDLTIGDTVVVSGMTPAGYNGTWTVLTAGLGDDSFRADIGSSPGAATVLGEAHEDVTSLEVRSIRKHVWYRFRVQAQNVAGCRGAWSAWTSWTLANDHVRPSTPTDVRIYSASTNRVVVDWEAPMIYLPTEGTVSGSGGTTTLTGTGTFFQTQIGLGTKIRIGSAGDVRTVTAIASDTSLTVDSNLSTGYSGEVLYTEDPDPDVAFYDVWTDTGATFAPPAYKRDRYRATTKIAIRPDDADLGSTFYARVRSFDASGNRSKWVDATLTGNSIAEGEGGAPAPDGVVIGAGGSGKTKIPWNVFGRLRVLSEANTSDYDLDEDLTLRKVRARVKVAPTGSSIIVGLYKNGVSIGTVTIAAGAKRGVNDSLTTTFVDSDRISCSVDQVGSGTRGENLTVVWVLS